MSLNREQHDIINSKVNTILEFIKNCGKELSDDEQIIIKWYYEYRVNHGKEDYSSLIEYLDDIISKMNRKNAKNIVDIIEIVLMTAMVQAQIIMSEKNNTENASRDEKENKKLIKNVKNNNKLLN